MLNLNSTQSCCPRSKYVRLQYVTNIHSSSPKSRKDLFFPHHIPVYYTLEKFHIHGSRILSRGFTVDPPASGSGYYQDEVNGSSHAMDVDELSPEGGDDDANDDDDADDDEEDEGIVSMVPMADMLNARYESENVCTLLFPRLADANLVAEGETVLRGGRAKNGVH